MDNDAPEGTCYICGHGNPDVIQGHHIVPRRYDGSDASRNIVDLCPSCHDAIERIYDNAFFEELGVRPVSKGNHDHECEWRSCTSRDTHRLKNGDLERYFCTGHRECRRSQCSRIGSPVYVHNGNCTILCDEHIICEHEECLSTETVAYKTRHFGWRIYCDLHADEEFSGRRGTDLVGGWK